MHKQKISKGFSLVELLIVVAIIGILAAVAVPAYFNHILRTHQAEAYHNLLDLKAAQEMFYSMYNRYAGPYTSAQFVAGGNTLTDLISFSNSDTKYYMYLISSASGTAFTARAQGNYGKLAGDVFKIEDDLDPCIESLGEVKLSLGLENCPPP